LDWLSKEDDKTGRCKVCRESFTVTYDSVKTVGRDAKTESHISKVRANLRSSTVDSYFVKTGTSEKQEVSCAELTNLRNIVLHLMTTRTSGCIYIYICMYIYCFFLIYKKETV
jgi:hypothetical protein